MRQTSLSFFDSEAGRRPATLGAPGIPALHVGVVVRPDNWECFCRRCFVFCFVFSRYIYQSRKKMAEVGRFTAERQINGSSICS